MNARDALEFLLVGASAVQVGTANFVNPRAALEILEGMRTYLVEQGVGELSEWIGSLELTGF